ncbi:MAG: helix-turn-helix transcriptional regulator [Clostridia bacterium]|nr:helix-turn-helix transcriptional regulator [Clostridia bacterium]
MKSSEIARFCSNIRTLREREGLSKAAMAKRLHIGVGTLTRLERGELPPRLDCCIIFAICDEFDISISDLFR